jgi:predicted MFS family arabinose efflux permease
MDGRPVLAGAGQATGRRQSLYVLLLVSLAAALNYYDRYLLAILIEPMRRELGLTDTQIGLLGGFAFAAVYCTAAIPIARIADRGRRVGVLALALAFWSAMTSLTGLATGYASLVLLRLGVAVGEAGGLPSSHALVVESVPKARRAAALSVVGFVSSLGVSGAMIFGGLVAEHWGWRGAFFLAGLPGLALALLIWLTVPEPTRPQSGPAGSANFGPGLAEGLRILRRRTSFVYFCAGTAFGMIAAFAFNIWVPSFLMRSFGLGAGAVSATYSLAFTVGSLAAALAGGFLYDLLVKRDPRWAFWLQALSFGAFLPLGLLFLFAPTYGMLLALTPVIVFVTNLYSTPAYALVQNLSGARLRSTAAAVFMLVANLVGFGVGPSIVGFLSDQLAPAAGADSLRYALAITFASGLVASLLLLKGAGFVARDFAEVEAEERG